MASYMKVRNKRKMNMKMLCKKTSYGVLALSADAYTVYGNFVHIMDNLFSKCCQYIITKSEDKMLIN